MLRDEQNPRHEFDSPVALFLDGAPLPLRGRARNLSRSGIFVTAHKLFQRGVRVDLAFQLPDGERVKARACVMRHVGSSEQEPAGMALRFLQLQQPGADSLDRYLADSDS